MIDWRTSARPPPPEGGLPNDASALLRKGRERVRRIEDELVAVLAERNDDSVAELQGNMSLRPCPTRPASSGPVRHP